jgi:methyl-accepting chemotaxis protein
MISAFNNYYEAGKKMAIAYVAHGPEGGNKMMEGFDIAAASISKQVDVFLKTL